MQFANRAIHLIRFLFNDLKPLSVQSLKQNLFAVDCLTDHSTTMSHLAPFSYLDRFVTMLCVLAWAILYITKSKSWQEINLFRRECWNVKAAVCNLLLFEMVLFLIYDILNMKFKYFGAGSGLLQASGNILNVAFTFKSSAHFLTLAFWSSVAKETFAARSFGSSIEFTIYKVYSVVSFVLYPVMQYSFPNNKLLSIIMPQFVYLFECFAVVCLTMLVNYRLNRLVCRSNLTESLQNRMNFYIMANNAQIFLVLLEFLSLSSINIDIVSKSFIIAKSPLTTDFLTKLFSLSICLTNIPMIMNLFPPRNVVEFGAITVARASGRTGKSPRSGAGKKYSRRVCPSSEKALPGGNVSPTLRDRPS